MASSHPVTLQSTIKESKLTYEKLIGYGGGGEVYRATWKSKSLGKIRVAAKKIPIVEGASSNVEIGNEITFLQQLDHPNIIKYFGHVVTKDHVVIVMEYAEKGSLYDYLKDKKGLPPELKSKWAMQGAKGIKYLQEKQVLHRDIKSPNFLITADDNLKICDFGIAKELTSTKTATSAKGTARWLAPEIFKDQTLSLKADIFAFGIVLWEIETCEIPYKDVWEQRIHWVVGNGQRPEIPTSCSVFLSDLMQRCWDGDRKNRPTMDEIIQQLESANNFSATPAANLEIPSTSAGQAYPIIPRTELDLIKQIGHGAYRNIEVYLAKWNNHDVAAKRLHEECRLEAEFLARLDHPNIVKLIGVVDERFDFFLVLELCDGGSLRSYLNDHKQQPLGLQFYDLAKQTARPIKYLKEKKIVHKDIKSPHYLLASSGALKLGNFGLAKNVDITISRATETASYPWMAPELLRDNILSPKYDVFAYGIVLWELWTRQMPFEDTVEPTHLVWRICNDNERPEIPTDCPKTVADLMRWCWETDWKMRPNMEQVLSQLASAEEEAIANPGANLSQ